jgi:anthranilate/para-aminobenzoate synthase component I
VTVRRHLRVAPDPLSIARSLAGAPGLALLVSRPQGASTSADARWSFVAAWPVETSVDLVPASDDVGDPAPRWIGWVPYDALRSAERPGWTRDPDERAAPALVLPAWRRYAAVVRVDHLTGEVLVVGDDEPAVASLARAVLRGAGRHATSAARPQLRVLPPDEPEQRHADRVRDVLRLIAAGDVYEVNLARRIPVSFRGDGLALFASLLEAAPAPWSFFQDVGETRVVATSPELALSVRGDVLRTGPIKGTRPRGAHADEDARLARELDADPKERAELTMAVDVHRNDLGRVAVPGSVHLVAEPRVIAGRTVWSRVAEVVARRAPGASLADVARAVLPCGSVTGAPKVRAMEVIARLEPWRRGLYTGAFGYVGRDGRLELAMAIRTLQLHGEEGGYFTGGGIVADSVPERELEETRWKAAQLGALAE